MNFKAFSPSILATTTLQNAHSEKFSHFKSLVCKKRVKVLASFLIKLSLIRSRKHKKSPCYNIDCLLKISSFQFPFLKGLSLIMVERGQL